MLDSPLASTSWSEADTALAHAHEIEQTFARCPCGCGGYADITLKSDGCHEMEMVRCDAKATADADAETRKTQPGELWFPRYVGPPKPKQR